MKNIYKILLGLLCFTPIPTHADTVVRNSIFSTSTDWESVTGMYLSQFNVEFSGDKDLVGNGLELYFLDGFPCFAQTDSARIWIGQNNKTDNKIRLTCLFAPKTVNFAWRNAARDAAQDKTTGILECAVNNDDNLIIDLSKCTVGKKWQEYR
jgi:hypothetical protein